MWVCGILRVPLEQEPMRDGWKASNLPYFQFCFLKFYPHTLPESGPYWVYFYYTTKSTEREWEKRAVLFRVHVRAHYRSPAQDRSDTYTFRFGHPGDAIWFVCDAFEEIRRSDGAYLTDADFRHRDGKQLLSAIRSSLAPIRCTGEIIVRQRTLHKPTP